MKTFTVKGFSAKVVQDNEMAMKFGIPSIIPSCFIDKINGDIVIITTSGFDVLSDKTQSVILTHELGHLALGHLEILPADIMTMNDRLEAEADRWAVAIVGVDALDKAVYETAAVTLDQLAINGVELTPAIRNEMREASSKRISNRTSVY